jgi:hypothetical protein
MSASPCNCAKCARPRETTTGAHDLAPSEIALAKVLSAWDEWPDRGIEVDEARDTLLRLTPVLDEDDWVEVGRLSAKGRDLVERARKAGVL